MSSLSIIFKKFSIERALSERSTYGRKTFKELITDEESISVLKLAECLDPQFDMEPLDPDLTWYFEEYYKNKFPIASSITVSNLKEDKEDNTLYFDANWLFENFKAKDHDDFISTLRSWKSDMKYALQCKKEILVNYGLRNNRYSEPIVVFHYA